MRLYILFMGPADQDMEWTDDGVEGIVRFLRRLWRVVHEVAERAPSPGRGEGAARAQGARDDREGDRRHRAALPVQHADLGGDGARERAVRRRRTTPAARFAAETAVSLIQPYAPHVAEELWQALGHERLWEQPWPVADESQLVRDTFELVVQVNGKVRDRFEVPTPGWPRTSSSRGRRRRRACRRTSTASELRKTIVVPDKLVNFVVG